MSDDMDTRNRSEASVEQKLEELHALIDDIGTALMTTRRADGELVTRPMATQKRTEHSDLWFVTSDETHKLDELRHDPHVNLGYMRGEHGDWVSVSGTARISKDRKLIHDLYSRDWRAWFGDQGGARDGGPDDPRITLILVEAHSAVYYKQAHSAPVTLFKVAASAVTGNPPKTGDVRHVSDWELHRPH